MFPLLVTLILYKVCILLGAFDTSKLPYRQHGRWGIDLGFPLFQPWGAISETFPKNAFSSVTFQGFEVTLPKLQTFKR